MRARGAIPGRGLPLCVVASGALLTACSQGGGNGSDALAGGGDRPAPAPVQLAEAEDWALVDDAGDPFAPFAAGRVRCESPAVQPEGTWIEVSTLDCNYATLAYAFAAPAPANSVITGEVAWSTLAAIDPAVATLAFALGGHEVWRHEVNIPGTANLVSVQIALPEGARSGEALYFHVRNHGYNSWQLSPLTLLPP